MLVPPGGQHWQSSSPSVAMGGFHQVTLRDLPLVSLQDPAPAFSSNYRHTPPLGAQAAGQEPAFLGPRRGWLLQAADISHIPLLGQVPSLHWLLMSLPATVHTERGEGRRREGRGHSQSVLRLQQSKNRNKINCSPESSTRTEQRRFHVCLVVATGVW